MPCAGFETVVSMSAADAFAFLKDPTDMPWWDPSVGSVEPLPPDEQGRPRWTAHLRRLLGRTIVYTLEAADEPASLVFTGVSADGAVVTRERYDITSVHNETRVTYAVELTLRGWRRLPCAAAITYIQLYRDAAEARMNLADVKLVDDEV